MLPVCRAAAAGGQATGRGPGSKGVPLHSPSRAPRTPRSAPEMPWCLTLCRPAAPALTLARFPAAAAATGFIGVGGRGGNAETPLTQCDCSCVLPICARNAVGCAEQRLSAFASAFDVGVQ